MVCNYENVTGIKPLGHNVEIKENCKTTGSNVHILFLFITKDLPLNKNEHKYFCVHLEEFIFYIALFTFILWGILPPN